MNKFSRAVMTKEQIHGAQSFLMKGSLVSVAVTETGGHMTAEFDLGDRKVSPYAFCPWLPSEVNTELPVLLTHLRGDFFCLPFGPQDEGAPHGDPANGIWLREESEEDELRLSMQTSDTGCRVTKSVRIHPEQTAIYLTNSVEGLIGPWSYGSHPILDFSKLAENQGRVSCSAFRWASVYHGVFADPAGREYQALRPGARFEALDRVEMIDGGHADLTCYPARKGFEDLVMMVHETGDDSPFAWTACVLDGYVWFSLKRPQDFPVTLFWISNGGRHSEPWDGRHLARLGIEDVCSYFCDSVEQSRKDLLRDEGIQTTREFDGSQVDLRLIQAVAAVPDGYGKVVSIIPLEGSVCLLDESGEEVTVGLDWEFLVSGGVDSLRANA
jgi:hypothetical protein